MTPKQSKELAERYERYAIQVEVDRQKLLKKGTPKDVLFELDGAFEQLRVLTRTLSKYQQ